MKYLASLIILIALTAFAAEKKRVFPLVGPCPKDGLMVTNAVPIKPPTPGWSHSDGTNVTKSDIYWFKCPRDGTKFPVAGNPVTTPVPRTAPAPPHP